MDNLIHMLENQSTIGFEAIPDELKRLDQWVLWRYGTKDGKTTKIPYDATSLNMASCDNPSTWTTFEKVKESYCQHPEFDGIGFVFTAEDNLTGVDLDGCLNKNGGLENWAILILDLFMPTYCEISPSGKGLKLWVKGSKSEKWKRNDGGSLCRKGNVEVYSKGRYFTVTGRIYGAAATEVTENQEGLDSLFDLVWGSEEKPESQDWGAIETVGESDEEILGHALKSDAKFSKLWVGDISDHPSHSEADLALCSKIAFWWKVPTTGDRSAIDRMFRQSGLYRPKWDRDDYRLMTIDKALEGTESRGASRGSLMFDSEEESPDESSKSNLVLTVSQTLQKTDEHFAEVFINLHGKDVFWCQLWGKWLIWDGRRWQVDNRLGVGKMARDVARCFLNQAAEAKDNKEMGKFIELGQSAATYSRQTAMLNLVKTVVPVEPNELDADPMLLNTLTGTIDLTTGEVKAHNREDRITKMTNASYGGRDSECPRWIQFLKEILAGDTDTIDFMQRSIGYALTGEIRENVIFILHGDGANGKTTLVEAIMYVLGDYAKSAAPDLLLQRRNESHPTGVADLMSARFVSSVEVDDGRKLNESLVKRLTGRDTIKARFMKQDFFDFTPSHKLFMAVNHRPEIQGTDKGIWRRIRLIPFEVEIPEEKQDQKLLDKLTEEASGILAWAVKGCLQWQHSGLGMPAAVKAASQAYKEESDVIGRFFDECCVLGKEHETQVSKLYDSFREWCDRNRERGYAANKFGQLVGKQNNLQKIRKRLNKKSCRVWQGIGLVSDTGDNGSVSKSDTPKNSSHINGSKDSKQRAVSDPRVSPKEMASCTGEAGSMTQSDTLGETRDEKPSESEGLQGESDSEKVVQLPLEVDYRLVTNPEGLSDAIAPYLRAEVLAVDIETTGLDPYTAKIRLIQIAALELPVLVIDVFKAPEAIEALRPLFSGDTVKTFQNGKFDLKFLTQAGVTIEGQIFDTMIAAQLLQAGLQRAASLSAIVKTYLGEELPKEEQQSDWGTESLTKSQVQYSANDAAILLPLRDVLKQQLIQAKLVEVATLEFDCIVALAGMELTGIRLDQGEWESYCQIIGQNINKYQSILTEKFKGFKDDKGDPINLNSTQQLQRALAEIGINVNSTSRDTLTPLVDRPVVADLLAYKKWQSQKSKYGNKISQAVNSVTGRIHADYHQIGADTGRLSCSNPPLQQIPKSIEVRQCFIPEPNCKFVIADYSQIELRVAAQISGDERMIQAYRFGKDLHKLTASLVTETPLEEVTDEDRQRAKAVNFGLLFAMGAKGLQDYAKNTFGVDMRLKEASGFKEKFFQSYSGFAKWCRGNENSNTRELRTLSGRRRAYNGSKAPLTEALNTPIQGTAADIAKTALGVLPMALGGTEAKVVGFIHDEFIVETPEENAEVVLSIVVKTMEEAGQQYLTDVPVVAEAVIAGSWAGK